MIGEASSFIPYLGVTSCGLLHYSIRYSLTKLHPSHPLILLLFSHHLEHHLFIHPHSLCTPAPSSTTFTPFVFSFYCSYSIQLYYTYSSYDSSINHLHALLIILLLLLYSAYSNILTLRTTLIATTFTPLF